MADFDSIAPYYDTLKRLVFGEQLDAAVLRFLEAIPEEAKILIVGGGSGNMLPSLKPGHTVYFVESSQKMIQLAAKRETRAKVEFVCASVEDLSVGSEVDVVITPFILDCFTEDKLHLVFTNLERQLKKGGLWLHTDFYPQNTRQKYFVKLMYTFFKLSAGLPASQIVDFSSLFAEEKFFIKKKAVFLNAMVHSYIYSKIG